MGEPKSMTDDATRPSLLRKIRNSQDSGAWESFVRIYGPLVYGFCRRSQLQENDAADVSQEVMMRVSKALQTFEYDSDKGGFRFWLGRVTRNEIARFYQSKVKRQAIEPNHSSVDWIESVAGEENWNEHFQSAILDAALKRIEPEFNKETWQAFEAAWLQDLSSNDVAQRLSIPIETVYVAKSRVLKRLKEELLILCEDTPTVARLG